jgi:hypothetical protein
VKPRHQADLVWRFQTAGHQVGGVPSGLAVLKHICDRGGPTRGSGAAPTSPVTDMQLDASDRADRIDAILDQLPRKPVSLARVLIQRYGAEENHPALKQVLPNVSGVAGITEAASTWFTKTKGKPPRFRSHDVRHWLESLCTRIMTRARTAQDILALAAIRSEVDQLMVEAETAYEHAAERFDRRDRRCVA